MVTSNKLTHEQKYIHSQINLKNARILQLKRDPTVIDTVTANKIKELEKQVTAMEKELSIN